MVRNNWIGAEGKFHIGVSDNAANVALALNSDVNLEAPDEIRDEYDGTANATSAGSAGISAQYTGRKGSLLTTLSDIVHERIENSGGHTEEQPGRPSVISKCQEISAYLSEPVLPVRSPDGKANLEKLRRYWYRHKNEWPALTRLALSYLCCPPSSVTSERVFSLAGNIVTKKRCALLPGNISKLAFIKFNYKKF